MRRPAAVVVPCVLVLLGLVACVGEDPDATNRSDGGVVTGERLGPCFEDKKCKEGLVCIDDVCLNPGEPPPDGGLQPGTDAGDAGILDAGSSCSAVQGTTGVRCGTIDCSASNVCCVKAGASSACADINACATFAGSAFACDRSSQCPGGRCCLRFEMISDTAKPSVCTSVVAEVRETVCSANCNGSDDELCENDADCTGVPGKTFCRTVEARFTSGAQFPVKICSAS